jgi:arginine N-succinyltransferase
MLMEEGFIYDEYIDVFDGGPLVEARIGDLRTVRESRVLTVAAVADKAEGEDGLMATGAVAHFRATRAKGKIDGDRITIDTATARALDAEAGSTLRWAKW